MSQDITPFEQIRRTNPAGNEFWSSRDFARVLGYADYRNFQAVIESARTACFNSGQRVDDHFVEVTEMVGIGKGSQSPSDHQGTRWHHARRTARCGEHQEAGIEST
jgi:DNA-damage-inducible protein D